MKTKFILLTFLLLFARGCDFYSTSLWFFQEGGMEGEMNPLTKYLGFGWNGLVISNIVIIAAIVFSLYYYFFKYKRSMLFSSDPANYRELASLQYFDVPGKFYAIFYATPKNKKVLLAHAGFVSTILVIGASFIATLHNLSQYYGSGFYDWLRSIGIRPLILVYTSIALIFILTYRNLLIMEFKLYRSRRTI